MEALDVHVLFIENDPADARLIMEAIADTGAPELAIIHVRSLKHGLMALKQQDVDVVLMDMTLPDASGIEAFKKIYEKTPSLPVILLTEVDDDDLAHQAIHAGAQDSLAKGKINGYELVRSIRYAVERKQASEALQENEARFRSVFEGVQDAIFVETPDGRILDVNQRACEMFGYTRDEFLTKSVKDIVPSNEAIILPPKQASATLDVRPVESTNLRSNGERFPVELSLRVTGQNGEKRLFVVVRDITERKKVEEEIGRRNEDMALINAINNAANRDESLPAILSLVSEGLNRILHGLGATIFLFDSEHQHLFLQDVCLSKDLLSKMETLTGIPFQAMEFDQGSSSIFRKAVDSGKPLLLNDPKEVALNFDSYAEGLQLPDKLRPHARKLMPAMRKLVKIKSAIVAPLMAGQEVIGLINIGGIEPFTQQDLDRVESIAGQLTAAIQRKRTEDALKQAEQKYRSIFENAIEGMHQTTPDGRILSVNPSGFHMLGYKTPEDWIDGINLKTRFYVQPGRREEFQREVETKGSVFGFESEVYRKDGTTAWISENSHVIRNDKGETLYYEGTSIDITARKRAETALRESEERFREIFENMSSGVAVYAPVEAGKDFLITDFNRAAEKIENFSRDTIIGKKVTDAFPGVKEFGLFDILQRVSKTGNPEHFPISFYKDDRTAGWRKNYVARLPSGEVIAVYDDETERRQAELALSESEETFRSFIEQSSEGVVVLDEEGRIIQWNRAQEAISGIDKNHALGSFLWDIQYQLLPPERRAVRSPEILRQVMQDGILTGKFPTSVEPIETRILTPQGEIKFILQSSFPIHTKNGLRIGSVIRDMTERKLAEMELESSHAAEKEFSERLARLLDISTEVSKAGSVDEVCRAAVDFGYSRLGLGRLSLWFITQDRSTMQGTFGMDENGGITDERQERFPVEANFPVLDLVQGQIPIKHLHNVELYLQGKIVGKGEHVFAGMWDRQEIIGYISVDNLLDNKPYSDRDCEIIRLYAATISQFISLKRAEATLRTSEEQYRGAIAAAGLVPYGIDYQKKTFTFIGDDILKLTGYPAEEFTPDILKSCVLDSQVWSIDHSGITQEEAPGKFRSGEIKQWGSDLHIRTRSGQERWISDSSVPITDSQGKVISAIGIFQDLTVRKLAEHALQESEARFRGIFDNTTVGFYQTTPAGQILMANQAIVQMLGFSSFSELASRNLEEDNLEPETSRAEFREKIERLGAVRDVESIWKRKDGGLIYVRESARVVRDETGKVLYYEGTVEDVTDRKVAEEAVRTTEHIYRQAIIGVGGVPYQVDYATDRYLFLGEGIQQLTGFSPDEFTGSAFFASRVRAFEPYGDDLDLNHDERVRLARDGSRGLNWREDDLFERKDGSLVWLSDHSVPVLDATGKLVGSLGILIDVTERKHSEEALRESEQRYRSLFMTSLEGIGLSQGNKIIDANRALMDMFGYQDKQEFLAIPLIEHVAPESRDLIKDYQEKRASGGFEDPRFEYRILRKDGEKRDLEISISTVKIKDETYTLSTFRDVTQRKQAEAALRSSEARYRTLAESSPDMIYVIDAEGRIQYLNNRASEQFHCPPDQVIGKPQSELFPPQVAQRQGIEIKKVLTTGITSSRESLVSFPGGEFWLDTKLVPISDETGRVSAVLGLSRDITGRKQAETELARQAEELKRSNDELARLYRASGSLLSGSSASLSELAQTIVSIVQQDFGQANCSLLLVQREARELLRLAIAGPYAENMKKMSLTLDGSGLVPQSIRSGLAINVGDVRTVQDYVPNWEAARSELAIPLKIGNDVIGVIDAQSAELDAFTDNDERMMTVFAERAALALEHSRLYDQTEARVQQMSALRTVDMAISSSFDIHLTLDILLDQVRTQLGVHAADILAYNPVTQTLTFSGGQGFRTHALQHTRLRLGEGLAGRAAMDRRILKVPDLHAEITGFAKSPLLLGENFISYAGVPLIAKGQIKGVLEIFQREMLNLSNDQQSFLEILAGQAGIALDNAELYEHQQRSIADLTIAYNDTLEGWAHALELRDKETEGHTRRVTDLTIRLSRILGVTEADQVHIYRGALLHDIGKIGVPDSIVLKPGPLTDEEWKVMRQHPRFAFNLLSPIGYLSEALQIPYCHHEKWDGTGYPRGLKGEEIPLPARIFAVVDVWDALTSDRPYRKAWTREKAKLYIQEESGKHFDPRVVDVFFREALT